MDGFKLTDRRRRCARTLGPLGPAWLALGAALAIATGGCAGSAAPGTTVSPERTREAAAASLVRRAAAATLAAPAGVEFKLEGASAFGPSRAPVIGSGEFDFPSATGLEKIDLGEVGNAEPGNEQALFLSERVYLQPKGLGSSVLPAGREWVSATLTGSDAVSTNFPSFVLQVEAVDPRLLLSELASGTVAAVPAGTQALGGVRTQRYLVTVDLTRALSSLNGPGAAALGQAIQSELAASGGGGGAASYTGGRSRGSSAAGAGQTSIAVWVGGGRVLQMRSAPPGAGAGTATMTLCCFGEPVAVSPPPRARVVDIAALTPSGERENNGGGDSDGG